MADKVGPFDGVPFSQAQWYSAAPIWAPSGVLGDPQSAVTAGPFGVTSSGLGLTVKAANEASRAWIRGAIWEPEAATKSATVTANAHATWSRRDRLVIRRDLGAQTVGLAVKAGTAAATPAAPTLTQVETGVWEESVCSFLAPPLSATTLSGFVDERVWLDPAGGDYASVTGLLALQGNYKTSPGTWGGTGGDAKWERRGKQMRLQGTVTNAVAPLNATAGAEYHAGTLPEDTAPGEEKAFAVAFGNGSVLAGALVIVRSDGQVRFRSFADVNAGSVGLLSLSLSGCSWTIGG